MRRLMLLPLLLSACATDIESPVDVASDTAAPLVGVDGVGDFADRSCQIVLRDFGRVIADSGASYAVSGARWIFEGRVDVQQTALAEGAVPMLLVKAGSETTWRTVPAIASTAMVDDVERFLFHVDSGDLPGPGLSAAAMATATIEVIPFLALNDSRLFDHNRIVDAFATYELNALNGFAVAEDAAVCAEAAGPTITFASDFTSSVSAPLVAGRSITIDYDLERLPACRARYAGASAWSVFAVARFLPMNVVQQVVLSDHSVSPSAKKLATLNAPEGATELVIYFQNNDRAGCNAYDSAFGDNYHFVVGDEAPQWLGNVAAVTSRASSSRCEGAVAVTGDVRYDSGTRQRPVVTDLCFEVYEPGVTDFDNADLWQQLDVQAHHRFDPAGPFSTSYVSFAHRVGNNAQYAVDLRALDPFAWGRCLGDIPLTTTSVGGEGRVQATLEVFFTVNGAELRPDDAAGYRVVYEDYASSSHVACD